MKLPFNLLLAIFVAVTWQNCQAQTARAYDVQLHHNVIDPNNGRSMLKATYKLECSGVQGHHLIPVLFIDVQKGQGHKYPNGTPMKHDGPTYYAEYPQTYWNGDGQFIGIYTDMLNPLPGTNTYHARILVWDVELQCYIGDLNNTEWVAFTNTGPTPSSPNNNNNSGLKNCHMCNGLGIRACPQCSGMGHVPGNINIRCSYCNGAMNVVCPTCSGSGKINW